MLNVFSMPRKVTKYLTDCDYRFLINSGYHFYDKMSDEVYLKRLFKARMGCDCDLDNPRLFNEKLQWLKLNDHNFIYTNMVDKAEAKRYVAERIGNEYIIKTLGLWEKFEDIEFDTLPKSFVLKCTHDSGGVVIVKDKNSMDYNGICRKITKRLNKSFYSLRREWPYKAVKPRIIAEEYMEDEKTKELRDYKFFCFNGEPKCYKVDFDRFINHRANYFDTDGNILEIGEEVCPPDFEKKIEKPSNLETMLEFAKILSKGLPFLRVDFYEVNEKIYFGELTFYPASGFGKFLFDGNDELLGSWLILPEK